jgi:hypothetical protein
MTGPRKHAPRVRENVLDGLSGRMQGALVMTNFNTERAQRLERTSLMDVALNGSRAVHPRRGGKK